MTSEEYREDQRKKEQFEKLSAKVISYTPWGTWYPLMKAASDLVLDTLPKQVGIKKSDGSPVIIYKKDNKPGVFTRIAGATVKPNHEYIGEGFRQGNFWKALGSTFLGGMWQGIKEQFSLNELELFNISPDEIDSLLDQGITPDNITEIAEQFRQPNFNFAKLQFKDSTFDKLKIPVLEVGKPETVIKEKETENLIKGKEISIFVLVILLILILK